MLNRLACVLLHPSLALSLTSAAVAQCQLGLSNLGQPVGLTGAPSAALVHDFDGAGPLAPELFIVADSSISAWNGSAWRRFAARSASSPQIPLASHDFDGSGADVARLVTANSGLNTVVAFGPAGTSVSIPGFFGSQILSLLSFDQDGVGPAGAQLIAAGNFTSISLPTSQQRNRIAAWDGTTWSSLGSGLNAEVQTLELWDADGEGPQPALLVAGGRFSGPGLGQRGVATWNGTAWSYLAFPSNASVSEVRDLATWDHDGLLATPRRLIAVGSMSLPVTSGFRNVAMWTGAAWTNVGQQSPLSAVDSVAAISSVTPGGPERLVIAGPFSIVAPSVSISGVAVFENGNWQPLGSGFAPQANMRVIADSLMPTHRVTLFGPFTTTSAGTRVNYASQWDGTGWRSMPDVSDANLSAPVQYAFDLVTSSGQRVLVAVVEEGSLSRVYRRDNAGWQPVGDPVAITSAVKWTPSGSDLAQIAIGVSGGVVITDGFTTTPLVTIANASDISLAVRKTPQGERLIVAGNQRVYSIAPSGALQQLGGQFNAVGTVLTAWDHDGDASTADHILAAGGFTTIAGQPFSRVARWNDSAWVNIGSIEANQPANVNVAFYITTWNHDNNPATPNVPVCLGSFQFANVNNTEVRGLTQWTGSQWAPMPAGRPWTIGGPARLFAWDRDRAGPLGPELVASSGGEAWSLSTQGVWQPVDGEGTDMFAVVGVVKDPARADQPDALFISKRWTLRADPALPAAALFVGACRTCDSIDFNNNHVFPEDQDVIDFFAAISGLPCSTCSDIDFNNNEVAPEDQDVIEFFDVLAGGDCP